MSPIYMAMFRAIWISLATGITAGLTVYMQGLGVVPTDPLLIQKAAITAILAALAAGMVRGAGEGLYDQNRANTGQMSSADVAMASADVTVIDNATELPVAGQKLP